MCKNRVIFNDSEVSCTGCDTSYPIIAGVPRFIAKSASNSTRVTFDRKWKLYDSGIHPLWGNAIDGKFLEISYEYPVTEDRYTMWRDFVCKFFRVDPSYFKGRVILDAGCGIGWLSYTMARLGATVIATDLADSSISLTSKILSGISNSKVIQADLARPPFGKESFDSTISLGVMHHTQNTRHTFFQLAKTVKPDGDFFLHLYEKVQPLRENLTELIRKIIHLFPKEVQLEICKRFLTIDFSLLKDKPVRRKYFRAVNRLIMLSKTPEETFDVYSPKYNHRHSFEEVKSWYQEAGFATVESLTHPSQNPNSKISYGGALWMVGRKRRN